jgi:hypothetical protein
MRHGIICFSLFAILAASGCGGTPQGQTPSAVQKADFTSDDGKFAAAFPGLPKLKPEIVAGKTIKTYLFEYPAGAYAVAYADAGFGDAELQQPGFVEHLLDSARDGCLAKVQGKLVSEQKITLDGNPGREIKLELPEQKGLMRDRVYLARARLYQVMVVGKPWFVNSADADQFLNSFKLIK